MRTPRTIVLLATVWFSAAAVSEGCGCDGGGSGGTGGTAGQAAGASGTGGHAGSLGTGGAAGKAGAGGAGGAAGAAGGAAGAAGVGGGAGAGGGKAGAGGGTAGAGGRAGGGGSASAGAAGTTIDAGASDGPVTCTDGGAPADGGVPGSRIVMQLDTTDPERVTNFQWRDSTSTLTANLAAEGGPAHCTDPQEFFGQSYSAPEGTQPILVVGGHLASLSTCGASRWTITGAAQDCTQTDQIPVTTTYQFYAGARASEVQVTRTFGFGASTPVYSGTTGLRPYVPRVPISALETVIYPNQAGTGTTSADSGACGGDCFVPVGTTWNGRWFADVNTTSGLALIVLRDPAMTSPVQFTVNNDSSSGSNLTSFVLVQPTAGWTAPVTEIEYLCFADLTTWPQAQRDAAVLPAGCGP